MKTRLSKLNLIAIALGLSLCLASIKSLSSEDQAKFMEEYSSATAIKTSRSNFFLGKDFKFVMNNAFRLPFFDNFKSFEKINYVNRDEISFIVTFDLFGNDVEPFIQANVTITAEADAKWTTFESNSNWVHLTSYGSPHISDDGTSVIVRSFDGEKPQFSEFVGQLYRLEKLDVEHEGRPFRLTATVSEFANRSLRDYFKESRLYSDDVENYGLFTIFLKRLTRIAEAITEARVVHGRLSPENITFSVEEPISPKLSLVPLKVVNFGSSVDLDSLARVNDSTVIQDDDGNYENYLFIEWPLYDNIGKGRLKYGKLPKVKAEFQDHIKQVFPVSKAGLDNFFQMASTMLELVQSRMNYFEDQDKDSGLLGKLVDQLEEFLKSFNWGPEKDSEKIKLWDNVTQLLGGVSDECKDYVEPEFPFKNSAFEFSSQPDQMIKHNKPEKVVEDILAKRRKSAEEKRFAFDPEVFVRQKFSDANKDKLAIKVEDAHNLDEAPYGDLTQAKLNAQILGTTTAFPFPRHKWEDRGSGKELTRFVHENESRAKGPENYLKTSSKGIRPIKPGGNKSIRNFGVKKGDGELLVVQTASKVMHNDPKRSDGKSKSNGRLIVI